MPEFVYKRVGEVTLRLHQVPGIGDGPRPAIVWFFGGGWVSGTVTQFQPHAEHYAARGITSFCAEYLVRGADA